MADRSSSPDLAQVNSAFRSLADEHAAARRPLESQRAWSRLEQRLLGGRFRGRVSRVWPLLVAALAVLLVGSSFALWRSSSRLTYEVVGATDERGVIRTATGAGSVRFSEGSRIDVGATSDLRLDVVGPSAALTRLNRGSLDVAIAHTEASDWRFFAGPYEVRVVGTRFRLAWEPATEAFSLAMREGRVRVLGPGGLDRSLSKGEVLDLSRPPPPTAALAAAERSPSTEPAGAVSSARQAKPRAQEPAPPALAPSKSAPAWPALVATGHFDEVLAAADAAGLDNTLATRGAADLRALAEAAHYSGRAPLALRAWSAVRQRFPGQPAAKAAAFHIGRIHDQRGRRAEALAFLDTYLSESPGDVYAAEALGRRLILVEKLQGAEAARRAAADYLKRYPSGAYSRAARAILGGR